jgi:putative phage-type endonuclease
VLLHNEKLSSNPYQKSADWFQSRIGCLTASRMACVLDFRKDGKPGSSRVKLLNDMVAERLTDAMTQTFVNEAMAWGIATEDEARASYEAITGHKVSLVGMIKHQAIEFCGASPDGLVGVEGLLEIKCPTTTTHIDYVKAGVVPDQYKPQMLLQLACTRRKWCDFFSYDPRILKGPKHFLIRFEPSPDDIAGIEKLAEQFLAEVDAAFFEFVEAA